MWTSIHPLIFFFFAAVRMDMFFHVIIIPRTTEPKHPTTFILYTSPSSALGVERKYKMNSIMILLNMSCDARRRRRTLRRGVKRV